MQVVIIGPTLLNEWTTGNKVALSTSVILRVARAVWDRLATMYKSHIHINKGRELPPKWESQWCSCVRVAVLQTVPEITQQQKTLGMSKRNYNNLDCLVMGNLSPGECIWLWFRKGFSSRQQYRSVAWAFILW